MPRSVFADAQKNGFIGFEIPEELGGGGTKDFRFNAVIAEEIGHMGMLSLASGIGLRNDICPGADARVARIYSGTNEIMKEIIGRDLTLS